MPLLLTHGWPGSFCEYLDLLPLLTDPQAHGGDPGDAFTVVVPSLPGFGFSAPPPSGGLTHSAVAALWHRLMADGLGYRRYVAHGSDLGAGVTAWLARAHADAVAGIPLATPGLPAPRAVDAGRTGLLRRGRELDRRRRRLRSPAGHQALDPGCRPARFARPRRLDRREDRRLEQHHQRRAGCFQPGPAPGHPHPVLGHRDHHLLDAPYWAYRHTPGTALPAGQPPEVPTAVSVFGGEQVPFPSRPASSPSATSPSPHGTNTTAAGASPPSPSHSCWHRPSATSSGQFAAAAETQPGGLIPQLLVAAAGRSRRTGPERKPACGSRTVGVIARPAPPRPSEP